MRRAGLARLRHLLLDHNLGARAHLRNQHLASLGDGTDRNRESIAAARQGDDVTLSFKRVAERFAQLEDVLAQVGFLDERVRPDLLQQLLLGDHFPPAAHQHQQRLKGLRSHRNGLAVAQQDLLVRVHAEWPELVDDLGIRVHGIGQRKPGQAYRKFTTALRASRALKASANNNGSLSC